MYLSLIPFFSNVTTVACKISLPVSHIFIFKHQSSKQIPISLSVTFFRHQYGSLSLSLIFSFQCYNSFFPTLKQHTNFPLFLSPCQVFSSAKTSRLKADYPAILLTLQSSEAADRSCKCVPQNQAPGVCRRSVSNISVCLTHRRENTVNRALVVVVWLLNVPATF